MHRLVIERDRVRESDTEALTAGSWSWTDSVSGEPEDLAGVCAIDPSLLERAGRISLIPSTGKIGDEVLCVLHSLDDQGHLLQLAMVIAPSELVTIHSSFDPAMSREALTRETKPVRMDLLEGRAGAQDPGELAASIAGGLISTLEGLLLQVAGSAGALDRSIREEKDFDSEKRLEDLFDIRHDLYTLHNRFRQNALTLNAAGDLLPGVFDGCERRLTRLVQVCEGERDFLQGVLDYYEQRLNMKMNFAMERLAVVTVIVLPVTAISGILGMNTIATDQTQALYTFILVAFMSVVVGGLLYWTKKKDWW